MSLIISPSDFGCENNCIGMVLKYKMAVILFKREIAVNVTVHYD